MRFCKRVVSRRGGNASKRADTSHFQHMKLKLHMAAWIARRIEKRSRAARRALRDYQRQERRRIQRDERRTRGLRLYVAWSQPATSDRCSHAKSAGRTAAVQLGIPQLAR